MVDRLLRAQLAHDLRRLATGRMTNDDFDDRYYVLYQDAEDSAVRAIGAYGYGLYSSDLPTPVRLRGRNALDRPTKRTIARCVVFLLSGAEYEWPEFPDDPAGRFVCGMARFFGFPAGIAMLLVGLVAAISDAKDWATLLIGSGSLLTVMAVWLGFTRSPVSADDWLRVTESGDYECWPFMRREGRESH